MVHANFAPPRPDWGSVVPLSLFSRTDVIDLARRIAVPLQPDCDLEELAQDLNRAFSEFAHVSENETAAAAPLRTVEWLERVEQLCSGLMTALGHGEGHAENLWARMAIDVVDPSDPAYPEFANEVWEATPSKHDTEGQTYAPQDLLPESIRLRYRFLLELGMPKGLRVLQLASSRQRSLLEAEPRKRGRPSVPGLPRMFLFGALGAAFEQAHGKTKGRLPWHREVIALAALKAINSGSTGRYLDALAAWARGERQGQRVNTSRPSDALDKAIPCGPPTIRKHHRLNGVLRGLRTCPY